MEIENIMLKNSPISTNGDTNENTNSNNNKLYKSPKS